MATSPLNGLSAAERQRVAGAVELLLAVDLGAFTIRELSWWLQHGGDHQGPVERTDVQQPVPTQSKQDFVHKIEKSCVMIIGGRGSENVTLCLSTAEKTWDPLLSPLHTPRRLHAATACAGAVYIVGGETVDFEITAAAERFSPAEGCWTRLPDMPTARKWLAAAAPEGRLFALGGSNEHSALATVEVFDPAVGTWETKPPMPTARSGLASAGLAGHIYALGGCLDATGTRPVAIVERFTPEASGPGGMWERMPGLHVARGGLTAASLGDYLYAVGGHNGRVLGVAEVYDPATGQWTTLPEMLNPRENFAAVAAAGEIYVLGGYSDTWVDVATVERYDPVAGGWAQGPDLPLARRCFAAAALDAL